MSLPFDLHVHVRERGPVGAETLAAEIAARSDLLLVALTDHDAIEPAASALARRLPLRLLLGAEITCRDEDGAMLHLLALGIRREEVLRPVLRRTALETRAWAARAEQLRSQGFQVARRVPTEITSAKHELAAAVLRRRSNRELVGLPDASAESQRAFVARYLGPAVDPVIRDQELLAMAPTVGVTITRIHEAGAVAVLAHPGLLPGLHDLPARIRRLVKAHELDGLEAYHPEHDENTRGALVQLAYRLDLLALAGSDSHGPERRLGLGAGRPDPELLDRLREQISFYR